MNFFDTCIGATITASYIKEKKKTYYVNDTPLQLSFDSFSVLDVLGNTNICPDITYSLFFLSSSHASNIFSLDSDNKLIEVYTDNATYSGEYNLGVSGFLS